MTDKPKQPNIFWPSITDIKSAEAASDAGYVAALIVAILTAAFATFALFSGKEVASINAWAYIDSVLFLIIAWRIRRRSRVFAVVGLLLFLVEKIVQMADGPPATSGLIMALFLALFFISGVRGNFALQRLRSLAPSEAGSNPSVDV